MAHSPIMLEMKGSNSGMIFSGRSWIDSASMPINQCHWFRRDDQSGQRMSLIE